MDASTTPRPNQAQATPGPAVASKAAHEDARPHRQAELSEAEERKLRELRETDARVRRHEEAHRAAAGSLYRGGPNYTYETGPDGRRYAVAGSVQIDTSPGRTPEETVQKAAQIRRAALAPTDPSGTDRSVASKATRMEDAARRAISKKSLSQPEVPTIATRAAPPMPVERALPEPQAEAQPTLQLDVQPPSAARAEPETPDRPTDQPPAPDTVSPSELGGEVWSTVSALSDSEQLKQDRRADEMPTPAPHLDVLA